MIIVFTPSKGQKMPKVLFESDTNKSPRYFCD